MESGFGQNLEGFLVKGNLSLAPAELPLFQGDGSIEASGTLYINTLQEYDVGNGVSIQNVIFRNESVYIPYSQPSGSATSASFVIDGGIGINHTSNSTSASSGGALTVLGGAAIQKNVYIGGQLDVSGNKVVNVSDPTEALDVANKQYVDAIATKLEGNFTTGQVIIAENDGTAIRGYDSFRFDGQSLAVDTPAVFGSGLDMTGNAISNVSDPVGPSDVATKDYVDNKTFGTLLGTFGDKQVIVGTSDPNSLASYATFEFDGAQLSLGGTMVISNTSSESLVAYGGVVVEKGLVVKGTIDASLKQIENVGYPVNATDAVTKEYVDAQKIQGNFTTGQLIVADSNGDSVRGYSNVTFSQSETAGTLVLSESTDLVLQSTQGTSLTSLGGASFEKSVFIGGGLDVNVNRITSVDDPVEDLDAVNKRYLDAALQNINQNIPGTSVTLNPNVLSFEDIPNFYYTSTVKAFVANMYISHIDTDFTDNALYTLYGVNCGGSWSVTVTSVGDPLNVKLGIRSASNLGIIQYQNKYTAGITQVRFRTVTQVDTDANTTQSNAELLNTGNYEDLVTLQFLNSGTEAFRSVVHLDNTDEDVSVPCGMVLLSGVLKDGTWVISRRNVGNAQGIDFRIVSTGMGGVVQYRNAGTSNVIARIKTTELPKTQAQLTLTADTSEPTSVSTTLLKFSDTDKYFQLACMVDVPDTQKSALFELEGLLLVDGWTLNSRFIGDVTGIRFSVYSVDGYAYLQYTNSNSVDAYMRFRANVPLAFEPIPVSKGGTGNDTLLPYAVLRGDGSNPIVGTEDFIYKDNTVILGTESGILIRNTTLATGVTSGGTFTTYGGASFGQNVFIGGTLDVNVNRITSVDDPVEDLDAVNKRYLDEQIRINDLNREIDLLSFERSTTLNNNVYFPENIDMFKYPESTKAFVSYAYLKVDDTRSALYTLYGFKCDGHWKMSTTYIGHVQEHIRFYIAPNANEAQVQYTNMNAIGFTQLRFKSLTEVNYIASDVQVNVELEGGVNVPRLIGDVVFPESVVSSKLVIHAENTTTGKYGMFLCTVVKTGVGWKINTQSLGSADDLKFYVHADGVLMYTNASNTGTYTLRVKQTDLDVETPSLTFAASTLEPAMIDANDLSYSSSTDTSFRLAMYVEVPELGKFATYDIEGVVTESVWAINYRYKGDYTGIKFYIENIGGVGYLRYTNSNEVNAIVKYSKDSLLTLKPLGVPRGGTGSSELEPYAVLRGNGVDPVVATNDFIYKSNRLILGGDSSMFIANTQSAVVGTTVGSFVTNGGVSVGGNLIVGQKVMINDIDVTPNVGDINAERMFLAMNDQRLPSNVTGFDFSDPRVKSFTGVVCVTITTQDDVLDALYELKGLRKKMGWVLRVGEPFGDDIEYTFSIKESGQIQYMSAYIENFVSSVMKFRALTTTYP